MARQKGGAYSPQMNSRTDSPLTPLRGTKTPLRVAQSPSQRALAFSPERVPAPRARTSGAGRSLSPSEYKGGGGYFSPPPGSRAGERATGDWGVWPELVHMESSRPVGGALWPTTNGRRRTVSDVSHQSQEDFAEPEETLVIFDWDDTLCPSFWAKNLGYTVYEDVPTMLHRNALSQVAAAADAVLRKASLLGKVVIVTNAETGWVELSCKRWLPSLWPVLAQFECVSARSTWEPTGVTSPFDWKSKEFSALINKFYSKRLNQSWKNVLSIGDSPHERQALQTATRPAGPAVGKAKHCRAKSIKFKVRPNPPELVGQLEVLTSVLDAIVWHDDNLDIGLLFPGQ